MPILNRKYVSEASNWDDVLRGRASTVDRLFEFESMVRERLGYDVNILVMGVGAQPSVLRDSPLGRKMERAIRKETKALTKCYRRAIKLINFSNTRTRSGQVKLVDVFGGGAGSHYGTDGRVLSAGASRVASRIEGALCGLR